MAEENIQLEDLIPEYAEIDDPQVNFQTAVSGKWEYAELASSPNEPPPPQGQFYNHQRLIVRYMLHYNRLMILHETGTGKSFLVGAVGEALRDQYERNGMRGIRHVYVVVTGETQQVDMRNMLICRSTNGRYLNDKIRHAVSSQAAQSNATRSLKTWYTITRYEKIAKEIRNMTDAALRRKYSDCLIVLDEVHNLRIRNTIDYPNFTIPEFVRRGGELVPNPKKWDKVYTYQALHRLTHIPDRIKVMGLTASLIIDDVNEASSVLNLILPTERQFPVGYDFNEASATLKDIEQHTRGYISYVRSLDTGAVEVKKGEELGGTFSIFNPEGEEVDFQSQIIVKVLQMSQLQSEAYIEAFRMANEGSRKHGKGLRMEARHASKGIYPDKLYGNKVSGTGDGEVASSSRASSSKRRPKDTIAFNKFVNYNDSTGRYSARSTLSRILENMELLKEYNIKAWFTIKTLNKSPGIAVVFDEFVTGSGLIYLSLAMQAQGFELYDGRVSTFKSKHGRTPYCANRGRNLREINTNFGKKLRFAMIVTKTKSSQITNILDVINSPENMDGEYVKVLLISGKATEGISVNNGQTFIQYGGVWNPTKEYQARSRVFRSTSHVDLIEKKYQELLDTGIEPEEARAQAKVDVNVYKLAAFISEDLIPENEQFGGYGIEENDDGEIIGEVFVDEESGEDSDEEEEGDFDDVKSIDMLMYQYSESKNIEAKFLLRKLKQVAVDCQIHHQRNVRDGFEDFSAECDYQECNYECFAPPPEGYDHSTYDIDFIEDAIAKIIPKIEFYFKFNGMGTLESIHDVLDPEDKDYDLSSKYLMIALARMIIDRRPVHDRYGFQTYIVEDNGLYYLTRRYPLHTNMYQGQSAAFYGRNLIANRSTQLVETFEEVEREEGSSLISELMALPLNSLKARILEIPVEQHSTILEDAISRFDFTSDADPEGYVAEILKIFEKVVFILPEPVQKIEDMAKIFSSSGKRKKKNLEPSFDWSKETPADGDGETVIFHTIETHLSGDTQAAKMKSVLNVTGKVRIIKPGGENAWRDMLEYELPVYREIVQYYMDQDIEELETHKFYGIVSEDGTLRVRNKEDEDKKMQSTEETDGRNRHPGRTCTSYTRQKLAYFMWELGVEGDAPGVARVDVSRANMIRQLRKSYPDVENWDDEKLSFYYYWLKVAKEASCLKLREKFEQLGLIWYTYIDLD